MRCKKPCPLRAKADIARGKLVNNEELPTEVILFLFTGAIIAVWYQMPVSPNYFGRPFALRFIKRNI